jgi:hypothetical protein
MKSVLQQIVEKNRQRHILEAAAIKAEMIIQPLLIPAVPSLKIPLWVV